MQEVVTATVDLEDIRSYRGFIKNYQVMQDFSFDCKYCIAYSRNLLLCF